MKKGIKQFLNSTIIFLFVQAIIVAYQVQINTNALEMSKVLAFNN